jgi:hypothetical protein
MANSGYPGIFPGGLTTGYENIGAVRKANTNNAGYPGVFPAALTTGYRNIGAVQKDVPVIPPTTPSGVIPTLLLMGVG